MWSGGIFAYSPKSWVVCNSEQILEMFLFQKFSAILIPYGSSNSSTSIVCTYSSRNAFSLYYFGVQMSKLYIVDFSKSFLIILKFCCLVVVCFLKMPQCALESTHKFMILIAQDSIINFWILLFITNASFNWLEKQIWGNNYHVCNMSTSSRVALFFLSNMWQ